MRLLIDECVDERLRLLFPDHDCQTARFAKLAGLKNSQHDLELLVPDFGVRFNQAWRRGENPLEACAGAGHAEPHRDRRAAAKCGKFVQDLL